MASVQSALTQARLRSAWIFLAPMMVVLVLVAGWPLIRTFWFSVTNAEFSNLAGMEFVGLENFTSQWGVLQDPVWWKSVRNTLSFTLISVSLETLFGLVVALVLNANFRGRGLVRAAILIPWAIPTIVSAKMWSWMLHDQFGIINDMLMGLGFISQPIAWTASPDTAMWAVIMVDVWKTTPFMALLILASLQMVPTDIYEAARVDGVHPVRQFFKLTLPLIRNGIVVAVIFRALDALRVFDLIYVLTSNSEQTMSMSVYTRQRLVDFGEFGYGSAAATCLFFVIALATIIVMMATRVKLTADN
jgi:trehalose/maltose transport system permease protein